MRFDMILALLHLGYRWLKEIKSASYLFTPPKGIEGKVTASLVDRYSRISGTIENVPKTCDLDKSL